MLRTNARFVVLAVCLGGLASASVRADTVITKSGVHFEGTVTDEGSAVTIETRSGIGTITQKFPKEDGGFADVVKLKSGGTIVGRVTSKDESKIVIETRITGFSVARSSEIPMRDIASLGRMDTVVSITIDKTTQVQPLTEAEIRAIQERKAEEQAKAPLRPAPPASPVGTTAPPASAPRLVVTDTYRKDAQGNYAITVKIANHEDKEVSINMVSLDDLGYTLVGKAVPAAGTLEIPLTSRHEPVVIRFEVAGHGIMRFDMQDK